MEKAEHLCGEIFGTDHYGQHNDQRSGVAHHTDSLANPMVAVELVIVVQSCLILLLEFGSSLSSEFVARKICHAGSGALMLLLDPREWMARWFVYSVVASSLAMTWIHACRPFRFARTKKDVGITIYLLLVRHHHLKSCAPIHRERCRGIDLLPQKRQLPKPRFGGHFSLIFAVEDCDG